MICIYVILCYNTNFYWANESNKGVAITAVETYCRLARLRCMYHVARMGEKPNSRLDPAWRNPSGPPKTRKAQEKFTKGLKNDLHKFDRFGK